MNRQFLEKNREKNFEETLAHYANAFESMTAETYHSLLSPLLADNVYFQDPFNELHGKENTFKVFEHMYQTLHQPKFLITHCALCNRRHQATWDTSIETPAEENPEVAGLILWEFRFALNASKPEIIFSGTTKVTFNQQGLIQSHIDYWDAGKEVYGKVPLLGWMIQKVRNKLAVN